MNPQRIQRMLAVPGPPAPRLHPGALRLSGARANRLADLPLDGPDGARVGQQYPQTIVEVDGVLWVAVREMNALVKVIPAP
jgi:hypothetical protein